MSMELEVKVKELEAKIAELDMEMERRVAVTEIQNCMARYFLLHSAHRHLECLDCFAMMTEDVSVEIAMWGRFIGPRSVYKNYIEGLAGREPMPGHFCEHPVSSPLIEVAADGRTAKCVWSTFGPETGKANPDDEEYEPMWMYGKFAVDMIKEKDGKWRMWHFQVIPDIMFNQNIAFTTQEPHDDYKNMFQSMADDGTTWCREYGADRVRHYWPQAPKPYETFAGTRPVTGGPVTGDKPFYEKGMNDCTFEEYMEQRYSGKRPF